MSLKKTKGNLTFLKSKTKGKDKLAHDILNKAIKSLDNLVIKLNPINAKKGSMVLIRWVDSSSNDGWGEEEGREPARCTSIGFVIHCPTEKKPWWTIIGDTSMCFDSRQGGRNITIPCCSVQEVAALGYVKNDKKLIESGWSVLMPYKSIEIEKGKKKK